jgi:hypothetical protein
MNKRLAGLRILCGVKPYQLACSSCYRVVLVVLEAVMRTQQRNLRTYRPDS